MHSFTFSLIISLSLSLSLSLLLSLLYYLFRNYPYSLRMESSKVKLVMKTLGAGFHEPIEGVHHVSLVSVLSTFIFDSSFLFLLSLSLFLSFFFLSLSLYHSLIIFMSLPLFFFLFLSIDFLLFCFLPPRRSLSWQSLWYNFLPSLLFCLSLSLFAIFFSLYLSPVSEHFSIRSLTHSLSLLLKLFLTPTKRNRIYTLDIRRISKSCHLWIKDWVMLPSLWGFKLLTHSTLRCPDSRNFIRENALVTSIR